MTQWALEHPWLTTFLVLCTLMVVASVGKGFAQAIALKNGVTDGEGGGTE